MKDESYQVRESYGSGKKKPTLQHKKFYLPFIATFLLISYVVFFMPTPYVVYQPGNAIEIRPLVEVQQTASDEEGAIFLTTVSMTFPYANVFKTVMSFFNPHMHLAKRADVFGEETNEEYSQRQAYVMKTSQNNAIQAVYHELDIPYELVTKFIYVLSTIPGTPAEQVLKPGDQMIAIDGTKITSSQDLLSSIAQKQLGDGVELTYVRNGKEQTSQITLVDLSHLTNPSQESSKIGVGIQIAEEKYVQAEQMEHQVKLNVENIGGPSAGLMFALEVYNLLTKEDITKGYRIAGTGTISENGEVGVIGGIEYKVVGADRQHADIFFAPNDLYPQAGQHFDPILNYSLAKKKADQINTSMQVVPVASLQEAIAYLEQLPPKQND